MSNTAVVLYELNCLSITDSWVHPCFYVGSGVFSVFCVVFAVLFVFVRCLAPNDALPVSLDCPFVIAPSVFYNVYNAISPFTKGR